MTQVIGDDRLGILAESLAETELSQVLSGSEQYTLLAPSDAAFDALPESAKRALANKETLERVLERHVIPGWISEIEFVTANSIDTLSGEPLEVNLIVVEDPATCCGLDQALLIDGVETPWTNLEADNGKIYIIDRVIWPPNLPLS